MQYVCVRFVKTPKAGESLQLKGQVQLILLQSKWLKKLIRATRDALLLEDGGHWRGELLPVLKLFEKAKRASATF